MGSNLFDKRSKMILRVNLLTENDAFRDRKSRNEFRYRRKIVSVNDLTKNGVRLVIAFRYIEDVCR